MGSDEDGAEFRRFSFREVAMGCEIRIELDALSEAEAKSIAKAAFERVHALDDVLSDYRVTSEIGRLPDVADTVFPLSHDLANALDKSLRISRSTGGRFDATIGSSTRLWRNARKSGTLPSDDALTTAHTSGGWRNVVLDASGDGVKYLRPGIRLDFGAIGKGLAAQAALDVLRSLGASGAMCAIAGDIACGGSPVNSAGWAIEVASGIEGAPCCLLSLRNVCISTSGDEFQHLDVAGKRHSHIIDPRTGRAVTRRLTATVICSDGAIADGLATALCVGGPELLAELRDSRHELGDFEARVVESFEDQNAKQIIAVTPGWDALCATASVVDSSVLGSPPKPVETVQTEATAASNSSDPQPRHPR